MDLFLVNYNQEKKEKKGNLSKCNISLSEKDNILYLSCFVFSTYNRASVLKSITFFHSLELDIKTGDFTVRYEIKNDDAIPSNIFKTTTKIKKNDFILLDNLIDNGLIKGEKKLKYWGVKFENIINVVFKKLENILKNNINNEFYINKNYQNKSVINRFYDLIVDFHLDKKNIKGYDGVYHTIQYSYPKNKWLTKNENKFVPAILDEFGIKSKYLIGKINDQSNKIINFKSLRFICKLFGDNYVDHIKKTNWENICYDNVINNKTFTLKNDSEKNSMIKLMNSWIKESVTIESFVDSINKLLSLREQLESKGYKLRFNAKSFHEYEYLFETWKGLKSYDKKGYKIRYKFPDHFKNEIEEDIRIDNDTYKIKILSSEDEYRLEGFLMKNCMSSQFINGLIFIFLSIECKKQRINLQVKNGKLVQSYGKANTITPDNFKTVLDILSKKLINYSSVKWEKEKYTDI